MIIGLDGSRAFLKYRTGIEEYSYQVIKHLRDTLPQEVAVRVYVRKKIVFKKSHFAWQLPEVDFELPKNWTLVGLWAPRFWTQVRLSLEMFFHPVDTLFIPAHTVPVIHPEDTTVVVHGLEYEVSPKSYSWWERIYMRGSIKYSVRVARKIIAVSQNTKRDLEMLYAVPAEKISVVYEGYQLVKNQESGIRNLEKNTKPYLLFIGRLEERKNVARMVEAFEMAKEKLVLPHALILAGKRGYGYEKIEARIRNSKFQSDIQELGYINESEKWELLAGADVFVFPSHYEGFGIPVLEAQSVGTPVVTSEVSSLPEIGGEGAVYVDPDRAESIAEGIQLVLKNEAVRSSIIEKGRYNVSQFSWSKCAQEIAEVI